MLLLAYYFTFCSAERIARLILSYIFIQETDRTGTQGSRNVDMDKYDESFVRWVANGGMFYWSWLCGVYVSSSFITDSTSSEGCGVHTKKINGRDQLEDHNLIQRMWIPCRKNKWRRSTGRSQFWLQLYQARAAQIVIVSKVLQIVSSCSFNWLIFIINGYIARFNEWITPK